jgi:hypothetical protein
VWESDFVRAVEAGGEEALEPLSVGFTGEHFFVVDGHRRLSAALQSGFTLVPARLAAEVAEPVVGGLSAVDFFQAQVGVSALYDWEAAHGVHLPLPAHVLRPADAIVPSEAGVSS